jgi:hypothetical protein
VPGCSPYLPRLSPTCNVSKRRNARADCHDQVFGRGLEPISTEVAVGPYNAGILAIISQPKRGTNIHARAPLNLGGNSMFVTG